jgi:hypothetical protein
MATESGYKSISRIDQKRKNHHGWYVRVTWNKDTVSKFFSDKQHDGKRKALQAAVKFRNETETQLGKPRSEGLVLGSVRRSNTGVRGVRRLTSTQTKGGKTYAWDVYQVTYHPAPGVTKRTSVSIQRYGEEEAFERACAIRKKAEKDRLKHMAKPKKKGFVLQPGITKQYLKSRPVCKVKFRIPAVDVPSAESVHLVGDFNEWSHTETPMMYKKEGVFEATLYLPVGETYQYRYLIDNVDWMEDPYAEENVDNPYGDSNSLLDVTDSPYL